MKMDVIGYGKYRNSMGEEVKVAILGWIRGSGIFGSDLMAIVLEKYKVYEVRADVLEVD